jgi:hypothetical protein
MKNILPLIVSLLIVVSCKKSKEEETPKQALPGGKGGTFNIAIFPENNQIGYPGKVYIKYGSDKQMTNLEMYDDSSATMTEPGFTHHAHFFYLKEGFYAIKAICYVKGNSMTGDTILEIKSNQSKSVDYKLNLK